MHPVYSVRGLWRLYVNRMVWIWVPRSAWRRAPWWFTVSSISYLHQTSALGVKQVHRVLVSLLCGVGSLLYPRVAGWHLRKGRRSHASAFLILSKLIQGIQALKSVNTEVVALRLSWGPHCTSALSFLPIEAGLRYSKLVTLHVHLRKAAPENCYYDSKSVITFSSF